jgi:hypothetical protein
MDIMNKQLVIACIFISFFFLPLFKIKAQVHFPVPKKQTIEQIEKWLPREPRGLGHPISDRAFWDSLAHTNQAEKVIQKANNLLNAPPLPVNKKRWMAYIKRKTERQYYMAPFHEQGRRFRTLVLAEVLQDKGRYLGKIEEILKNMLSLGTWKKPQSWGKVSKSYWYGKKHFVDLAIAGRSFEVATAYYWLQDKLGPGLRKKLRKYIKKDAIDPYLKKVDTPGEEFPWMTYAQNWNAVCTAGVVGAGLLILKNRKEKATLIAAAEIAMNDYYLKEFGDDGYCSEGIGYWGYGFGHFLALNEMIRLNTQNNIDWLKEKRVKKAALFPARAEILNGIYSSYSDTHGIYARPAVWLMDLAKVRMGLAPQNDLSFLKREKLGDIALYYQGMLQIKNFPIDHVKGKLFKAQYHSKIRDFFPSGGLLINRPWKRNPRGMAVSIKGGNNGEDHNHDDLGTFEVVAGSEKLIIDPGSEIYGRHTFNSDRYKSEMMNSFGHCVPVVAGHLQSTGKKAKAVIIKKHFSLQKDFIKYDLSSAYDVKTLKKLTRSFTYKRGNKSKLIVTDEVVFTQPEKFQEALIVATFNQAINDHLSTQWKLIGHNRWRIQAGNKAIKVAVSSPGNKIIFKTEPLTAFRMPKGYNPIRLSFSLKGKVKSAKVIMKITSNKNK